MKNHEVALKQILPTEYWLAKPYKGASWSVFKRFSKRSHKQTCSKVSSVCRPPPDLHELTPPPPT